MQKPQHMYAISVTTLRNFVTLPGINCHATPPSFASFSQRKAMSTQGSGASGEGRDDTPDRVWTLDALAADWRTSGQARTGRLLANKGCVDFRCRIRLWSTKMQGIYLSPPPPWTLDANPWTLDTSQMRPKPATQGTLSYPVDFRCESNRRI